LLSVLLNLCTMIQPLALMPFEHKLWVQIILIFSWESMASFPPTSVRLAGNTKCECAEVLLSQLLGPTVCVDVILFSMVFHGLRDLFDWCNSNKNP
jgi:hypothetical protein